MRMHPRQEMNFHGSDGLIKLTSPFNPQVFGEAEVHFFSGKDGMRIRLKNSQLKIIM